MEIISVVAWHRKSSIFTFRKGIVDGKNCDSIDITSYTSIRKVTIDTPVMFNQITHVSSVLTI